MFGGDCFVMPDDFLDDEVQELLSKIRIQISILGQTAKAFDLVFLARRVCRRQFILGFENANRLGAL